MSGEQEIRPRLRRTIGRPLRRALNRLGYDVISHSRPPQSRHAVPRDCDAFTTRLIERVRAYTMTTPERIIGLVDSVRHLVAAEVPGAFAECGVWRGGSVMAMAYTLLECGETDRDLYLFDTFGEIPAPGEHDVLRSGRPVAEALAEARDLPELQHLPENRLRSLLEATGYPSERFHLVKGRVEETLPAEAPDRLALCRLDTDLYGSTAHELLYLWPRLAPGGILLIDDYGAFMGAKKAVDEYFERVGVPVLLHRLDFSARLVVKPR